jgi:hypothetical protein
VERTENPKDSDGGYRFQQFAIGDYRVTAEKQGFRTFVAEKIHLDLNQLYDLDIRLEVGTISEMIVVEANQVQVETFSAQLGTVIDSNQVVNMPLLNRNWINLQQLEPGVVAASDGRGNLATNRAQTQQNSFLINLSAGANFGASILGSHTAPFALIGSDGNSYAAGHKESGE